MDSQTVRMDVQETIRFFDEIPEYSIGQATSVVSVVGEDMGVACFQRHLEASGATVTVRSEPVTTGKQKGPRLDRWVVVDWPDEGRVTFQTEIKNWSAHAIGGKKLALGASSKELRAYKMETWENEWDSGKRTFWDDRVAKVLVPMQPPEDLQESRILPLVIYWAPMAPESEPDSHLFKIIKPKCKFSELWVFSVSSYLRSIEEANIDLTMPIAADRLRTLGRRLFQVKG